MENENIIEEQNVLEKEFVSLDSATENAVLEVVAAQNLLISEMNNHPSLIKATAKHYRSLYDALIEEKFLPVQALEIVKASLIAGKKM